MDNYFSFNETVLNDRKLRRIDDKVMVFIVPSIVQLGVVQTEVRFPYSGKIIDAYATCGTVGGNNTVIDIEKCSQSDYDTNPVWTSIFTNKLTIDGNKKSNRTSTSPFAVNPNYKTVNPDDHFRLNMLEVGLGVKNITVELVVELNIDEP